MARKSPELSVVIPVYNNPQGCKDLVGDFYRLHEPDSFRIIVIDQTKNGIQFNKEEPVHVHLRPYRNLGFSKAMNAGWKLVTTPYTLLANDDVRLLHSKWYHDARACLSRQGVLAVNPISGVRTWDWDGNVVWLWDLKKDLLDNEKKRNTQKTIEAVRDKDHYICPHCGIAYEPGQHDLEKDCLAERDTRFDFVKDKKFEDYTEEDYEKIKKIHGGGDGPGTAMFFTLLKTKAREIVGLLDERYLNNGEDYDWNRRCYLTCSRCGERKNKHMKMQGKHYCIKDNNEFYPYNIYTCKHSVIHHHCGVTKKNIEALEGGSTFETLVRAKNIFNDKWNIKQSGNNDIYGENGTMVPSTSWYTEIDL